MVRRGYDRAAVDTFARDAHAEITELRHAYETLAAHYAQLQAERDAAPAAAPAADYSGLGGRAQEILRIAEEQALDLTSRAAADADRLTEQTEHEVQTLRDHAVGRARRGPPGRAGPPRRAAAPGRAARPRHAAGARPGAEAEQLLQAARFEAGGDPRRGRGPGPGAVEAAELRATHAARRRRAGGAGRPPGAPPAERERVLAELSARVRRPAGPDRADAGRVDRAAPPLGRAPGGRVRGGGPAAGRGAGRGRADPAGGGTPRPTSCSRRARQQAATVEERSRQEFAWRRRQLRQEQDLLTRRKQAMLSQLTSLSALAVETADSLPDVPGPRAGRATRRRRRERRRPDETASADRAAEADAQDETPATAPDAPADEAQNSRSSALSMPRSTS